MSAEELKTFLEGFRKDLSESSTVVIRRAITDAEAKGIAEILKSNAAVNLRSLTLDGSRLLFETLQTLAEAIDHNHSLITFDIINIPNIGDPEDALEMIEVPRREAALNKIELNIKRNKDEASRSTTASSDSSDTRGKKLK